ncbi:MAG TPA: hypothetical protein VN673_15460 [Clostridia bacterium]|nr:hypothetical protein [Clostridia bacterium]
MSLRVLRAAAAVERSDEFNEARLLILMRAAGNEDDSPIVDGIMKLAKMDFLLRYPEALDRVLAHLRNIQPDRKGLDAHISPEEKKTIEAKMIRFRYGPYDWGYRRWFRILLAKGLVLIYRKGATIKLELTRKGESIAEQIAVQTAFWPLAERAEVVNRAIGSMRGTKATDMIYEVVPELNGLRWGEEILL